MPFVPVSREPSVSVEEHVAADPRRRSSRCRRTTSRCWRRSGCPVCERVVAPMDLPAFDNSGDGRLRRRRRRRGGRDRGRPGARCRWSGESAAGQAKLFAMSPGTAVKIMTGAPVPQGADAVVPVEWTDGGAATVRILKAPQPGQHVRRAGRGRPGRRRGARGGRAARPAPARAARQRRPGPGPLPAAAARGDHVDRRGAARAGHQAGATTRSTTPTPSCSPARSASTGAIAYRVGVVSDDPAEFSDALSDQLVRADLVVTSGGVSKGEYDVVKEVLSQLGTVWFGEVRMQPGKPQGFGHIGEDRMPIFALPGNPVSSYVSFELFVLPALRRMMGRTPYQPAADARAAQPSRSGRLPARRSWSGRGHGSDGRGPTSLRSAATARTCSATCPTRERDHRGAAGRRPRPRRAAMVECSCSTGTTEGVLMADETGSPTSTSPARRGWSTCPARTSPAARRSAAGPGAGQPDGRRRCCAARACRRGTRSGSPGSPGSWPPSGPPTSCRSATRWRSAA